MPNVRINEDAIKRGITEILAERGKTHGDFTVHAMCTQDLKSVIRKHMVGNLTGVQQEAVDMICHKLGRIAAGDPFVKDHWDDIAGYATLVADRTPEAQNGR